MTDNVPRALEPSDAERLATLRAAMTHGGAGGISRAIGPVLDRGLVRAIAGDLLGDDSLEASDSHIQGWSITGTGTSVFELDFDPVDDSWNLELNGVRVHRSEFSVSGRTLTITAPTDLFKGAATQGSPWDLEIQYDYLTGAPVRPATLIGTSTMRWTQVGKGTPPSGFYTVGFDDSLWTLAPDPVISFGGGSSAPPVTTYAWSATQDVVCRAYIIDAKPGVAVTLTYDCDDALHFYWNGVFQATVGIGPGTVTVLAGDVLASNVLALHGQDFNPANNEMTVVVSQ